MWGKCVNLANGSKKFVGCFLSHRSILLAVCWPGPTANLSRLSFDGVVSANSQCFCCSMDCCRTSFRKKRAVSPTPSAFQISGTPGSVFGRRSTVLLRREVFLSIKYFFDLNDDGQAAESVLFLLFGRKRFVETFPTPSILDSNLERVLEPFVYSFLLACRLPLCPRPQERKVSRETCAAIGPYLIEVVIDFTPWAERLVALATRGFLRSALTRLASHSFAARLLPLGGLFRKPLGPGYSSPCLK